MTLYNEGRILSSTTVNAVTRGTFGKPAAGDLITPCNVKGEAASCIFVSSVDAGKAVGCGQAPGIYPMLAGGPLDDNEEVIVGASGKPMSAADEGDPGDFVVGRVVRGSSAAAEDEEVAIDFYAVPQRIVPAP